MENTVEKRTRLIEGVNIGRLPDIFENLTNEKVRKIKGDDSIFSLNDDYRRLLESVNNMTQKTELYPGDVVNGVVKSITDREIVIDFQYKDYIYIENKNNNEKVKNLEVNSVIDVLITEICDHPYIIKGSITDLMKINIQDKIKEVYDKKDFLMGKVTEIKPAGFMLDINIDGMTIEGFMPNTLASANKLTSEQSENLVGTTMEVMLESLQQDKGIYVVNRKKYLYHHLIPKMIKQVKVEYTEDKQKMKSKEIQLPRVYDGYVTGTSNFGVFVEFMDCLTGMIHKYNINPTHQNKLHDILPGTPIQFFVKEITKKDRIILTQIIRESLWDSVKVGHIVKGTVIDVKSFGVLVKLDEETNGLIQNAHIPEGTVLKSGDTVNVKIVSMIKDDRKIYLSLNITNKNKKDIS